MAKHQSDVVETAHIRKQLAEIADQFQASWTNCPDIAVTLTHIDHKGLVIADRKTWRLLRTEFDGPDEGVRKLKAFMERGSELLHDLNFPALKELPHHSYGGGPWSHETWLHALIVTLPHLPLNPGGGRITDAAHRESWWRLDRIAKYCEMFANHLAGTLPEPAAAPVVRTSPSSRAGGVESSGESGEPPKTPPGAADQDSSGNAALAGDDDTQSRESTDALGDNATTDPKPHNLEGNSSLPIEAMLLKIAQDNCKPAEVNAWLSQQYAIRKQGTFKNLTLTHGWLEDNFQNDAEDLPGCLIGYELPSLSTWQRYVTAVRKATDTNVNRPRHRRPHGKSIVDSTDI